MSDLEAIVRQNEETPKPKNLFGVRHFQCLLMFVNMFVQFTIRTCLSVAIISMTAKNPPHPSIPTYPKWNNSDTILSSFFWGYVVTQLAAGQLSEYFGPKWFLVTTIGLGSAVNIVIPPMAAAFGSTGVMICRVLQGLCQGFSHPCTHYLISRWTPVLERTKVLSFVYGGANLGTIVSTVVTGSISASKFGWPGMFYLFGSLGTVWAIAFAIFSENSPSTHKTISEEEKRYIESTTSAKTKKVPTPWTSFLTCVPIWIILLSAISHDFGFYVLLTEIPSYMDGIMNFDIKSNGELSSLPYVANFFLGVLASPLFDFLIANSTITITEARKISNSLGVFLPAAALICLAFLEDSSAEVATVLFTVAVGFSAFSQSGYVLNLIDLAPNHSGTLLGAVTAVSSVFSILAPLVVGLLGSDKTDPILWRKVFLIAVGIYVVCGSLYVLFASADLQPWNDKEINAENREDMEKNKNLFVSCIKQL